MAECQVGVERLIQGLAGVDQHIVDSVPAEVPAQGVDVVAHLLLVGVRVLLRRHREEFARLQILEVRRLREGEVDLGRVEEVEGGHIVALRPEQPQRGGDLLSLLPPCRLCPLFSGRSKPYFDVDHFCGGDSLVMTPLKRADITDPVTA